MLAPPLFRNGIAVVGVVVVVGVSLRRSHMVGIELARQQQMKTQLVISQSVSRLRASSAMRWAVSIATTVSSLPLSLLQLRGTTNSSPRHQEAGKKQVVLQCAAVGLIRQRRSRR
jgi:hypothetical protein